MTIVTCFNFAEAFCFATGWPGASGDLEKWDGIQFFFFFFNKIAIQGTPQMAVDKEAICLSRVYSYYPKCNFPLFYV